jgi:AraC-like DNA-binding protein
MGAKPVPDIQICPAPPDFRLLRFISDTVAARDRIDAWRQVLAQQLFNVTVDPLKDEPYRARVMLRAQHDVRIGTGTVGASINRRSHKLVSGDNDDFILMVNLDGWMSVSQRGRESTMRPGDAFLLTCTEKGVYTCPSALHLLCLRIPHASLTRFVSAVDQATGKLIPRESGAIRLLKYYAATLFSDDDIAMTPGASRLVVDHITDLAALAVGTPRDVSSHLAARSGRDARMRVIKSDIERYLTFRELSIEWLAERHGISERQLYRLFEREGTTFAEHVRGLRLEHAHSMLASPQHDGDSIIAIASQCGFDDVSYFNRLFRNRFGATPSDVRRAKRG